MSTEAEFEQLKRDMAEVCRLNREMAEDMQRQGALVQHLRATVGLLSAMVTSVQKQVLCLTTGKPFVHDPLPFDRAEADLASAERGVDRLMGGTALSLTLLPGGRADG